MARLLLVEDDAELLELQSLILRRAGHEVLSTQSAEAALKCFQARRPDVVIMDYRIPRPEDGAGLIRDLGPGVRVIVLSGASLKDTVEGAARVLRKPCSPRVLLQAIAELA